MSSGDKPHEYSKAVSLLARTESELIAFAKSPQGVRCSNGFSKTLTWIQELIKLQPECSCKGLLVGTWSEIVTVLALVPSGFTTQSFSHLRAILESIAAFSYYFNHPIEFQRAQDDDSYWVTIREVLEFHTDFTWKIRKIDPNSTGTSSEIQNLFSELSKLIHAGVAKYSDSIVSSFNDFRPTEARVCAVAERIARVDEAVSIFLCSVFGDYFGQIGAEQQRKILKGWNRERVLSLNLCA